jgi:hypothetical protein
MRKGLAPIIDEVTLTLIVVVVVSLMVMWGTTIVTETTDTIEDEAERVIDCNKARLLLYKIDFRPSGMMTHVANIGKETFHDDVVITAGLQNGSVYQKRIAPLPTGKVAPLGPFTAIQSRDEVTKVSALAVRCPEITATQVFR